MTTNSTPSKFPIFRRSISGAEIYCVLSESEAFKLTKRKAFNGVMAIRNKTTIDYVINPSEDNKDAFKTITQNEFKKEFEEVSLKIDDMANLMDKVLP